MHGKGKYTWSDGREYEGQWKHNLMDGYGVCKYKDGRMYTGMYKNH